MRLSLAYLLAGLVALALACAASASHLLPADPAPRGTANIDYGRPVPLDATAQRELVARVAAFDASCTTESRVPPFARERQLLDAIAATRCERAGAGPTLITSARFSQTSTMNAYFDALSDSFDVTRGACVPTDGVTTWGTRRGTLAGRLLCLATSKAGVVAWSENRTRTVHYASGDSLAQVLEWWQRTVRPQRPYPTGSERKLLKIIDSRPGSAVCARENSAGSPLALATIRCDVDTGVPGAAARAYFALHTRAGLTRYLRDLLSGSLFHDIQRSAVPCQRRSYQLGSWGTVGRGTLGRMLCLPRRGGRSLSWTIDALGVYATVNAVGIDSPAALYRVWERRLRGIGA
jgi:hypothetical protein